VHLCAVGGGGFIDRRDAVFATSEAVIADGRDAKGGASLCSAEWRREAFMGREDAFS
jgi:hypothetical protein